MTALSILIGDIQRKFSNGCPNGFLLEWDANRFFQDLLSLFLGFKVTNDTDFNYSYCNSFDIELGKNNEGKIFVLTLKISFIIDAYTVHITRYSSNQRAGNVISIEGCLEYSGAVEKVRSFMEAQGFIEVQDDDMAHFVENVELELAERATVGKCLFDDFE